MTQKSSSNYAFSPFFQDAAASNSSAHNNVYGIWCAKA